MIDHESTEDNKILAINASVVVLVVDVVVSGSSIVELGLIKKENDERRR